MPLSSSIGAININEQGTNSALAVGQNQLFSWKKNRKTNNGSGFKSGLYGDLANHTYILDNDIVDGNIFASKIIPSAQEETL